jgi:excisionase family DNA binding protein
MATYTRTTRPHMRTTHPNPDPQLVFTSSEAADYIGVSLATIRRWSDAGHIACYRTPGGQRRFSSDQLDEFVSSLEGHDAEHGTQKVA